MTVWIVWNDEDTRRIIGVFATKKDVELFLTVEGFGTEICTEYEITEKYDPHKKTEKR